MELEDPDYKRFPRLRDLHGFETLVGPGDLIYIPNCWWHQVETLTENSVSVTFWYKVGSVAASEDAMVFIVYLLIKSSMLNLLGVNKHNVCSSDCLLPQNDPLPLHWTVQ